MNDASPLASTIASSRFADGVAFIDGDYDIHWLERLVGLKK